MKVTVLKPFANLGRPVHPGEQIIVNVTRAHQLAANGLIAKPAGDPPAEEPPPKGVLTSGKAKPRRQPLTGA